MLPENQKKIVKRIFASKLFLFFLLITLVFLGFKVGQESYYKYQLQQKINNLKSEIDKVEGENNQLSKMMNYLKNESYLEQEARVKLNLKKPGEKVVIFPGKEKKENSNFKILEQDENAQKNSSANHWRWWEYFFEARD